MPQENDPYKIPIKDPDNNTKKLRNMKYYILNALKFYELKNENLTPIIFLIILLVSFSGALLSDLLSKSIYLNVLFVIISFIIENIAATIYLKAYLNELKGEVSSFKDTFNYIMGKFWKIILAYVAFIIIMVVGTFLLVIPGIIFYFMFMFNTCLILDKDMGVIEAFNSSRNLTHGRKMELFSLVVLFNLIIFLPLLIIVGVIMYSTTGLVFNFIISFAATILTIMQQRLTALLYKDLAYSSSGSLYDEKL